MYLTYENVNLTYQDINRATVLNMLIHYEDAFDMTNISEIGTVDNFVGYTRSKSNVVASNNVAVNMRTNFNRVPNHLINTINDMEDWYDKHPKDFNKRFTDKIKEHAKSLVSDQDKVQRLKESGSIGYGFTSYIEYERLIDPFFGLDRSKELAYFQNKLKEKYIADLPNEVSEPEPCFLLGGYTTENENDSDVDIAND